MQLLHPNLVNKKTSLLSKKLITKLINNLLKYVNPIFLPYIECLLFYIEIMSFKKKFKFMILLLKTLFTLNTG